MAASKRIAAPVAWAAAAAIIVCAAVLGARSGGVSASVALVVTQLIGLGIWFGLGGGLGRAWATANAVTGAAWVVLFVVPSAVYAVAPSHLPGLNAVGAIAGVNVSLFAMTAGYALVLRGRPSRARAAQLAVLPAEASSRRAAAWFGAGLLG